MLYSVMWSANLNQIHSSQIGDVQKDKLPGPEALLEPGKKDGQVC